MVKRRSFKWIVLLAAVFLLGVASLFIGRYPSPPWMPPRALFTDRLALDLALTLRLPRVLAALLVGAVLGASGLAMQMLFRNPLVEPGFLGVSQGAAFGAALAILYFASNPFAVQASAAVFGLAALGLTYLFARRLRYGGWVLRMVLAGIAVSALFSAGVGLLKYLADPLTQLPEIVFWLLGGLWATRWSALLAILPATLLGLSVLFLARWRLNVLVLEDDAAFALGARPGRERALFLVVSVVAVAAAVSLSGIVAWVGLMIPHLARRFYGVDGRSSLPASLLLGGAFTLLCDDLSRTITVGEIPLGIITALLGSLAFVVLLASEGREVEL